MLGQGLQEVDGRRLCMTAVALFLRCLRVSHVQGLFEAMPVASKRIACYSVGEVSEMTFMCVCLSVFDPVVPKKPVVI